MSSSVAVSKSSPAVIRPPEVVTRAAAAGGAIKLTPFERVLVRLPFTVLLVFERPVHEGTESIRRALSQALVHYYPFAGRISSSGADGDDGFCIRCTGEGVEFVAASVDCGLTEAKIFDDSSGAKALLDELAIYYPVGSYGSDDPLLSVQATEFACGGVVLGATWNHAVADGAGIAQFLAAVGELARGMPSPSILPVRCDDAVSSLPPLPDPVLQATLACPESTDMELLVPLDVTVPSALIDRVKAEYSRRSPRSGDGRPCTTFEAVLWRCRVRATTTPGASATGTAAAAAPVLLTFAANTRVYAGARAGYYGNCVANLPLAAATSGGAVAGAGLADLVGMVRRAKARLPDKLKKGRGSGAAAGDDDRLVTRGLRGRYDMLHVSSWRNIGFEGVDLGGGAPPARVMLHARGGAPPPVPTCVVYPPCRGKDGVNVLAVAVKEEHAGAFLAELAMLAAEY